MIRIKFNFSFNFSNDKKYSPFLTRKKDLKTRFLNKVTKQPVKHKNN